MSTKQLRQSLKECRDLVARYVKDLGGCDHSVGICACADYAVIERADEALKQSEGSCICPWCGDHITPQFTAEHLNEAEFIYNNKNDHKAVRRNPLMCPECHGVGGYEDFEVVEAALSKATQS